MIALGCDHGGYELKEELKRYLDEIGIKYKDFGTHSKERTDYPIYAEQVAKANGLSSIDEIILKEVMIDDETNQNDELNNSNSKNG